MENQTLFLKNCAVSHAENTDIPHNAHQNKQLRINGFFTSFVTVCFTVVFTGFSAYL